MRQQSGGQFHSDFKGLFSPPYRTGQQCHLKLNRFFDFCCVSRLADDLVSFCAAADGRALTAVCAPGLRRCPRGGLVDRRPHGRVRDFRFIVPFIVQFGLYVSPVGFRTDVVPEQWRLLYSLNPMVGVIDGFRWCVLGGEQSIYWPGVWLSVLGVSVMVVTGIWYFRHTERTFADVI